MLTEKDMLSRINGNLLLPPLTFRVMQIQPDFGWRYCPDALIEVSWKNISARFIVEVKSQSTPLIFRNALNLMKSLPRSDYMPMIVVPFLNESQLRELELENVSGVDLCGNGVVTVPEKFSVFRSGGGNRFPSSAPIKNIYRKNSSMVSRAFLVRPLYSAVEEVRDEVNRRNILVGSADKKPMSLSTVSKVLKTLQNDVIIDRADGIRLLQPDTLLETLSKNYTYVKIDRKIRYKVTESFEAIPQLLGKLSRETGLPLAATGLSSVTNYTVMQRGDILSVYCPDIEKIVRSIPGNTADRFPNLELVETEDETVFFDAEEKDTFLWASPVQVYLELMAGDKRDKETAEQVKSFILQKIGKELQ